MNICQFMIRADERKNKLLEENIFKAKIDRFLEIYLDAYIYRYIFTSIRTMAEHEH